MPPVNLCDLCGRWNRDCPIHPAGEVNYCTEHRAPDVPLVIPAPGVRINAPLIPMSNATLVRKLP